MSSQLNVSIPENSFIFQKPIYTKIKNEVSSSIEPAYIFKIDAADTLHHLKTFTFENKNAQQNTENAILNEAFQSNPRWWIDFLENFINFSKSYFSRNYTVQQLTKVVRHVISEQEKMKEDEIGLEYRTGEVNIEYSFTPKKITIHSGKFLIDWDLKREVMLIDIPVDSEDDIPPVSNTLMSELGNHGTEKSTSVNEDITELKELTYYDIPLDTTQPDYELDESSSHFIDMRNGNGDSDEEDTVLIQARYYDKQKVKEARLRAKLAYYKAQKSLSKYQQKYGEYDTDTDVSNTSSDSSDITDTEDESSGDSENE
jgi:hypothetical protein